VIGLTSLERHLLRELQVRPLGTRQIANNVYQRTATERQFYAVAVALRGLARKGKAQAERRADLARACSGCESCPGREPGSATVFFTVMWRRPPRATARQSEQRRRAAGASRG
jgi:hypothetical protein